MWITYFTIEILLILRNTILFVVFYKFFEELNIPGIKRRPNFLSCSHILSIVFADEASLITWQLII